MTTRWSVRPIPASADNEAAVQALHDAGAIEAQARALPEIRWLRAVVLQTNDVARPFWERLGFFASGQTRPHEAGTVKTTAVALMKALERP